jgi:hypothetical protein
MTPAMYSQAELDRRLLDAANALRGANSASRPPTSIASLAKLASSTSHTSAPCRLSQPDAVTLSASVTG